MHIIHRGIVSKKYKENLLSSFKQSFKRGHGVETDIHITKDGKFICYHDFTLSRIFNKNKSIKNLSYLQIKKVCAKTKRPIPLLKDLLNTWHNKFFIFIEIKPYLSKSHLKKLLKETSKFNNCVFISFKHENIYNLLKIKRNINVGLSFATRSKIKTITNKSKNNYIKYLILDKSFIRNKSIQKLKIKKYFYTIKTKAEFKKYKNDNNLIFENL